MAADGLAAYRQYEEIGAGLHSRVYKARKRLGIEFVALRKVDKCRQPKLLNEVRASAAPARARSHSEHTCLSPEAPPASENGAAQRAARK